MMRLCEDCFRRLVEEIGEFEEHPSGGGTVLFDCRCGAQARHEIPVTEMLLERLSHCKRPDAPQIVEHEIVMALCGFFNCYPSEIIKQVRKLDDDYEGELDEYTEIRAAALDMFNAAKKWDWHKARLDLGSDFYDAYWKLNKLLID